MNVLFGLSAGVPASNDKLSSELDNPYNVVASETSCATSSSTTPATATPRATPRATARPAAAPATAPAGPKQVNKKKQFTTPFPIPSSELKDYVSKKKKETYKEGNGFLFDYEVSHDNDGSVIITTCKLIVTPRRPLKAPFIITQIIFTFSVSCMQVELIIMANTQKGPIS